jgi:hypothetical protein
MGMRCAVPFSFGEALFTDQLLILGTDPKRKFANRGDSGCIAVDEVSRAVGMVVATATGTDVAFVSPMDPVLKEFGVQLL